MAGGAHSSPVPTDVLVIGAGLAGLRAALELAQSGQRVVVLEARARVGGRVHSVRDPHLASPVELGAEFLHDEAPEMRRLAAQAGLAVLDSSDEHLLAEPRGEGRAPSLVPVPDFWERIEHVIGRIPAGSEDRSFAEFLGSWRARLLSPRTRRLAASFIEGFHAAELDRIGIRGLAAQESPREGGFGAGAGAGERRTPRVARILGGCTALVEWLRDRVERAGALVLPGHEVTDIQWRPGEVRARVASGGGRRELVARSAILAVPLGVLKARYPERGAIRFRPELASHRRALARLESGSVIKLQLVFRSRFWERLEPLRDLSFLHAESESFPTWWSLRPAREPSLVAWAGGAEALRLADLGANARLDRAVGSLARATGVRVEAIQRELRGWQTHDWDGDPYARGAYSYLGVGGVEAQRALAAPLEHTLFFAGEATQGGGANGSMEGALLSGARAAREVLERAGAARGLLPPKRPAA